MKSICKTAAAGLSWAICTAALVLQLELFQRLLNMCPSACLSLCSSLEYYAYKDSQGNFIKADGAAIKRFQTGLQNCFAYAVKEGFKVLHILGHVDPVHPVLLRETVWRNFFYFAPLKKYGGYSYQDIMVAPVCQALSQGTQLNSGGEAVDYSAGIKQALLTCGPLAMASK